jgi:hypothetical protein
MLASVLHVAYVMQFAVQRMVADYACLHGLLWGGLELTCVGTARFVASLHRLAFD